MNFKEFYLKESADVINTQDGKTLDYMDDNAYAFSIYKNFILFAPSMTHGEMETRFLRMVEDKKYLPSNFREANRVSGMNYDPKLDRYIEQYGFSVEGRFWREDPGYIAFWTDIGKVKKHRQPIEHFIHELGFNPKEVLWEIYDEKVKDEETISYQQFFSISGESEEAERRRQEAKMMHLVPGAKKALGKIVPGKQQNIAWKNLTTFGDALNQLTKSIKRGKSCIVENIHADLLKI